MTTLLETVFNMPGSIDDVVSGIVTMAEDGTLHLAGVTLESDLIGVNCEDD